MKDYRFTLPRYGHIRTSYTAQDISPQNRAELDNTLPTYTGNTSTSEHSRAITQHEPNDATHYSDN